MKFFKKTCKHDYKLIERSNILQLDEMGYPLRLCMCKCEKCGTVEQMWLDTNEKALDELDNGKSFLLKWENI